MTVVLKKQVSVSKKTKKQKNSLLVRENANPTWEGGGNANLGFYGPKINLGVGFFLTPRLLGVYEAKKLDQTQVFF